MNGDQLWQYRHDIMGYDNYSDYKMIMLDEGCYNFHDNHKKYSDNHGKSNTFMYQKQTPVIGQHLVTFKILVLTKY